MGGRSGCTAVLSLLLPLSAEDCLLVVSNTGDSRAVGRPFHRPPQRLSEDHTPDTPTEVRVKIG